MIHSTNNEWGIAELPLEADAGFIVDPVVAWGSIGRTRQMPGTWHFYVGDYRFSQLMKSPRKLVDTGCFAACEMNLSVFEQSPRWEALRAVGEKRALSSTWAAAGVRILVDVCMPRAHRELSLIGVPRGWKAYSTRAFAERPEDLADEWNMVREHSNGRQQLMVIGGGESIRQVCLRLPGAVQVAKMSGMASATIQHHASIREGLHNGGGK